METTDKAPAVITLLDNATTTNTLTVANGKNITLDLNGRTLEYDNCDTKNSVITVLGTFTLKDGSVEQSGVITGGTGSEVQSSDGVIIVGGGVYVNGGTFMIESGTISGNEAEQGGGVNVNNYGTFTMAGGYIRGNTATVVLGGGVCVAGGAEFTMTGGTISENTAYDGGGVYVAYFGTFIMTGGTIGGDTDANGNSAQAGGGGVAVAGGGSFAMDGGAISHNYSVDGGGGVYIESGEFTLSGGAVSGNASSAGGGLAMQGGTVQMSGGEISDNTAFVGGCGVVMLDGSFTMTGGEITGNNPVPIEEDNEDMTLGGGVTMQGGTFELDGGSISGNTARFAGGVVMADGTFIVKSGSISDNTGVSGAGGILLVMGTLKISGGSITGNKQIEDVGFGCCGGVCIGFPLFMSDDVPDAVFEISGAPIITDNTVVIDGDTVENNVLVMDGYAITVSGAFTEGAKIGVNNSGDIATGYKQAENPSKFFIPDNPANNCIYISDKDTGTVTIGEHDYSEDFTVDVQPTCTEKGSKSKHCANCDEKGEVTVIAALGHSLDYNPAVAPTNDQNGNIEFWDCVDCKKFFADEDGKEEIKDKSSVIIPKLVDPITSGGISGTDILWITLIVVLGTAILIEVTVIIYRAKRKARNKKN